MFLNTNMFTARMLLKQVKIFKVKSNVTLVHGQSNVICRSELNANVITTKIILKACNHFKERPNTCFKTRTEDSEFFQSTTGLLRASTD